MMTKSHEEEINIRVEGKNLEIVEEYKHRGTIISKTGKVNQEIKQNIKDKYIIKLHQQ